MVGRGNDSIKVCVYPADMFGCGHFRLIHPARVLIDQGYDVTIMSPGDRQRFSADVDKSGRVHRVGGIPEGTDVIVMQRVAHTMLSRAIPVIRAQGIAVVIDMDDDLSCIHPSNPAWAGLHPRAGHDFSWNSAAESCRNATMVTTTTPILRDRYMPLTRCTRVIDNYVPADYLSIPHTGVTGDIAYAGSLHSHPDDVPQVHGAIRALVDDGIGFRVVGGEATGFREALGLLNDPDASGGLHISEWPHRVAGIGVGIAPLADTAFNAAKSRLKVLEMSALGVPWVASPRAEYMRFHNRFGGGLLARKERQWVRLLRELSTNDELRVELSEHGRDAVKGETYESNAWRWMEAWTEAVRVQRG